MGTRLTGSSIGGTVQPNGARVSLATVDPASLGKGLAAVGLAVDQHDANRAKEADKVAQALEQEAMQAYEPQRAEREATYTGEQPGYSAQEIDAYEAAVKPLRERADIDPIVRRQLEARLDARKVRLSDAVIQFEATRRAGVVEDRRKLSEAADDAPVLMDAMKRSYASYKSAYEGWDGKSGGLADRVLSEFDAQMQAVLEPLPEAQKLRVQASLIGQRNRLFAQAMEAEDKGLNGYVVSAASDTQREAVNMVLQDPDAFQTAGFLIDKAAQALPGPLQDGFRKDARREATIARLGGLIRAGRMDEAQAELKANGNVLDPRETASVMGQMAAESNRKTTADFAKRDDLSSRMAAYFDDVANGREPSDRPGDEEVRSILGEEALYQYRRTEKQTQAAVAQFSDFDELGVEAMDARLSELKARADAGGPEFAQNSALLQMGQKIRDAQVKARASDPARWAMSGDGSANDPAAVVDTRWKAIEGAQGPQAKQSAFAAYAAASIGRQGRAGIRNPQLLPVDVAKGLVEQIEDAPDEQGRTQALLGVADMIRTAGTYRKTVLNELRAAGLGGEEATFLSEQGQNVPAMRAYVAGGPVLKDMKGKDKNVFMASVQANIAQLDRTLVGGNGSPQKREERHNIVARMAAGYMAQGLDREAALKKAAATYTADYVFSDSYRIPARVAATSYDNIPDFQLGKRRLTGPSTIAKGVYWVNRDIEGPQGTPYGAALSTNEAEGRRKYREVKARGRWVTRDDDSGLMLVVPNEAGTGWQAVKDRNGAELSFSWEQLIKRAQRGN